MNREITINGDDLHGVLETVVRNVEIQSPVWWMRVINTIRIFRRRFDQNNFASVAKRNVAHHYDLSGARFMIFFGRIATPVLACDAPQSLSSAHSLEFAEKRGGPRFSTSLQP